MRLVRLEKRGVRPSGDAVEIPVTDTFKHTFNNLNFPRLSKKKVYMFGAILLMSELSNNANELKPLVFCGIEGEKSARA